jgi:hypothetical protein
MEGLIREKMVKHLEDTGVFSNVQHGFTRGRSCLTNLLEAFENWTTALDEGFGLDIIYLDFSKAFDTVPHKRLCKKLRQLGIGGKLLEWITDFLSGRYSRVGVRGEFCSWMEALSGVPQGSVLGPLFFLTYVNDLPDWMKCQIRLFADDTKLWKEIATKEDSLELQLDLDNLMRWSNIWQLKFNAAKCKVMHVGHTLETSYFLRVDDIKRQLAEITEERDLGVVVTNDLKPAGQCVKAAARAMSVIGMIGRQFRKLDKEDFLILYKSFIRPHVEYCIQAWSPYRRKDIQCLETVQRRATKLVEGLERETYEERLQQLGFATLEKRRKRGDMIEVYRLMTGKERIQYQQFFNTAENVYNLRGHSMKLYKERPRLDVRKHFFSNRVIDEWNSLPQSVIDAESVNAFKNRYDKWKDVGN